MKKKSYTLIFVLFLYTFFGQSPNTTSTDNHVPQVIPASPTVAALMKFEETPVSNYNGIPDISIPIYGVEGNLNFDISLKYHPLSIKHNEVAGDTGLGWSLFAGGTISRTVRGGYPDDYNDVASQKKGIYFNSYNDIINVLDDNYSFDHDDYNINNFFFEASEKQRFDTEYDLYQYNFMGYSGRFIIVKLTNGTYQVKKLTTDTLKITYDDINKKFEIVDEKGYTFTFDIKETSSNFTFSHNQLLDPSLDFTSGSKQYNDYISAFHLSKIKFQNNLIAELMYDGNVFVEKNVRNNIVKNEPVMARDFTPVNSQTYLSIHQMGNCGNYIPNNLLPLQVSTSTTTETKSKVLQQINIIDKARIYFSFEKGNRQDENILQQSEAPYLKKITVKNWNNVEIKSFVFNYDFYHKLFLKEIINKTASDNEILKYGFKYFNNLQSYQGFSKDLWGFYRSTESFCDDPSVAFYNNEVDKQNIAKDVLTQIIYPTKGSAVFEYEPNTYSFIGDTSADSEIENNSDNWTISHINNATLNSSNGVEQFYDLGLTLADRRLLIKAIIDNNSGIAGFLNLYKYQNQNLVSSTSLTGGADCYNEYLLEQGYTYKIGFRWNHQAQVGQNPVSNLPVTGTAHIDIYGKTLNAQINKWLYGGGIRIKNIYYFKGSPTINDNDIKFHTYPIGFERKLSYQYHLFDDNTKSSGSLVYPKPVMEYQVNRKFKEFGTSCGLNVDWRYVTYKVQTELNNLSAIVTKGSDVGYKNVTVTEQGKGKTEYTYTSPIDYPEQFPAIAVSYPFIETSNQDYKRGLLLSDKKYNNTNKLLNTISNTYNFHDYVEVTGLSLYYSGFDCPYASTYLSYSDLLSAFSASFCGSDIRCSNASSCGKPANYIGYYRKKDTFGWAELTNSINKDYYDSNGNEKILTTTSDYTYNLTNLKLKSSRTTYPDNSVSEISYNYASDKNNTYLIANNIIGVPLETVATKKANPQDMGKTISKIETIYPLNQSEANQKTSGLPLPAEVKSTDLLNTASTEITYNQYDSKGNLQQYTTKDGIPTAIVWGYNQAQPIAKIVGATYAQVSSLAAAIISASDLDASDPSNEAALITALDNFRKDSTMANYQISTYTYDPLIGVTSITPPSGIREVYLYDSANRLKEIREGSQTGKLLKEFKYNYKN